MQHTVHKIRTNETCKELESHRERIAHQKFGFVSFRVATCQFRQQGIWQW